MDQSRQLDEIRTATYEGTATWTIVSNRMSKRKHESRYALKTYIGGVKDKEQQGEGVSKKTGKFNDYLLTLLVSQVS